MKDTSKPTKGKRRWLRFSLRTFLIFVLIFSIWLAWYVYRVEQQKEAVQWILDSGGVVYYDYEWNSDNPAQRLEGRPTGPSWLRICFGIDYLSNVVCVDLHQTQVINLNQLASLPNLKCLIINETDIRDLEPLAKLRELKILELSDTSVSELQPLARLHKLEYLGLNRTAINDVSIVSGLRNLQILNIRETQVNELTALSNSQNLVELDLGSTAITNIQPLSKLSNLYQLNICDTSITNLEPLFGMKNLKHLIMFSGIQASDDEIEKLKLALPNCKIHD